MKKTTKSMLITSLILFAAGLILALSSALYVKISGIDPFLVEQKVKTIEDKTVSLSEILAISPDSNYMKKLSSKEFSKIDLNSYAGDLVICSGEETRLELNHTNTNNLIYQIIGETLIVKEEDPVGFFGIYIDDDGFSFKGLRQIFGPGNSANSGKTVTLYLSPDFIPEQIDISSTIGNVTIDSIFANQIHIDSFSGTVTVKNLQNPDGKVTVTGDRTDIVLENNRYISCNTSTKFGSIQSILASEENDCSTVLDAWMGRIYIQTASSSSRFKLSLSTSFGTVSKNGVVLGKECNEPSETSGRITANVLFGDIELNESEVSEIPTPEETETSQEDIPQTSPEKSSETNLVIPDNSENQ